MFSASGNVASVRELLSKEADVNYHNLREVRLLLFTQCMIYIEGDG